MSILQFNKADEAADRLFDPETTRLMGEAFDAACALIGDLSKTDREAIANRIIGAALGGECNPHRLRNAGLAALRPCRAA